MTATVTPGIATTGAGTPLPLIALPQDEILTVNINDIPLLKDAAGPGIHIQTLRHERADRGGRRHSYARMNRRTVTTPL